MPSPSSSEAVTPPPPPSATPTKHRVGLAARIGIAVLGALVLLGVINLALHFGQKRHDRLRLRYQRGLSGRQAVRGGRDLRYHDGGNHGPRTQRRVWMASQRFLPVGHDPDGGQQRQPPDWNPGRAAGDLPGIQGPSDQDLLQ